MINLKTYHNFLNEADAEMPASLEFRTSQKEYQAKIQDLTGKLKAALDDNKTPEKEVNMLKLQLKIAKLKSELLSAEYGLSKMEEK
jgi:hypothetical protein